MWNGFIVAEIVFLICSTGTGTIILPVAVKHEMNIQMRNTFCLVLQLRRGPKSLQKMFCN